MKLEIRSAYSDRESVNNPVSGEPSRTKQEFKSEVDINEIVARMRRGVQPPPWMTSATPRYGDFTNMPASFQEAYAIVQEGEQAFKSLPLEFRRALDHNPANLDSAPRELYEQYGLLNKDQEAASDATSSTLKADPQATRLEGTKEPKGSKKAVQNADE